MNLKPSYKTGLSFGVTSGVITTLGLLIGLMRATSSKSIALSGILIIALTDALSDSFGIHISEESTSVSQKEVWESTISTFLFKFLTALSFLIPVLLFSLNWAIFFSSLWGICLLVFLSYKISKNGSEPTSKVIIEHVMIAILVILLTYFVGGFVSSVIV